MSKLFVSYSRQDEALAATLIDDLKTLGHTVWFDRELSGGQAWWDRILTNIRECEVFVFVLSENSQSSTACKREYRYADALRKPILPVLLADGINVNLLPPALAKVQYADYRKRDSTTALLLARAFITLSPPSPLPDPLPDPPSAPISHLGGLLEQIESSANLSLEAQSVLLLDLKRGLHDSRTRTDTLILLDKFKNRRDIYASIFDEIHDLLESFCEEAAETQEQITRTAAQPAQPSDNSPDQAKPNQPLSEPIPPVPEAVADSLPELRMSSVTSERAPSTQSIGKPIGTTRQPPRVLKQNEPTQPPVLPVPPRKEFSSASETEPAGESETGQPTSLPASNLSRRRVLKLLGFVVGGGLGTAWLVEALRPKKVEYTVVTVDEEGNRNEPEPRQNKYRSVDLGNGIQMGMVNIPEGNFLMGSPESEEGHNNNNNEGPQRDVMVPSFWIGQFQVTQAQWQAVVELPKVEHDLDSAPSHFKGDELPAEQINWWEATEFCNRLSAATGRTYRLPSEAEWEYACRAGTTTPFHFGETITTDLANYKGNYTFASEPTGVGRQQTTPVGSFGVANEFGLYDMHGNVWEWCEDAWHENYDGAPLGGTPWIEGGDSSRRVVRGGSWVNYPRNCRSARRAWFDSDDGDDFIGFRVVCSSA
ncbi:MAG: SUMF1/EgtB/PvdO family nonheme iron enzyme [Synechococcus sp.]